MYNKLTLEDLKKAVKNGLKILHLDCETSPNLVYSFYIGQKVSLSYTQIKEESKVICVQYKWEGDKKTKYLEWDQVGVDIKIGKKVFKKGLMGFDDAPMLEKVSKLIDEADIIVGQNIDAFDLKVLNHRLMIQGLTPIDNDNTIDLLKLSRKSFRRLSHKLDYRAKALGGPGKNKMEFQDWIDVTEGKVSATKKMIPYGCKDVDDAQALLYAEFDYYKALPAKITKIIRSFLPSSSNEKELNNIKCRRCNGQTIKKGSRKMASGKTVREWQCKDCGAYTRTA